MKKILFVFGSLRRAGAQLRTLEVCGKLRQRYPVRCDFCVVGRGLVQLQAEVDNIGGTVHLVPARSALFTPKFSALLRRGQYDVVNSFPHVLSGLVLWLARTHHVPIRIASFRNALDPAQRVTFNPAFIWLMRTLINSNATHIVAVSQSTLDDVFPPPWSSSRDCRVIYNGVAWFPFQGAVERREVRQEFGWPLDSGIVINVARFSRHKNHGAVLEATRLAHEKHTGIRLLLVGDGDLRDEIVTLIDHYDLKDICAMAGLRTDVPRLLLASNVFFFPSLREGLPGALLEALAAGLPAVASDIPQTMEIAEYFPSSILTAPAGHVEKHAEHILAAMSASLDRSSAEERFMNTPFTLEKSTKAYGALYGLSEG
jgi:glycosyltransferase involved in cell wall biosynthesis